MSANMSHDVRGTRKYAWSTKPNADGYAKICIDGESFWLRECKRVDGGWVGIIDNELCNDRYRLDDTIIFAGDYSQFE